MSCSIKEKLMFRALISLALMAVGGVAWGQNEKAAETASMRLADVLKGEWQSLDVTLVGKSTCMGPMHRGQRITRQDGRIEMRSLETSSGMLEEGPVKAISAEDLRRIVAAVVGYYEAAERSEGRGEWLKAKVADISDNKERDLKIAELMRAGGAGDTVSIAISCKTGKGRRVFDDEFDNSAVASFSAWVVNPLAP